MVKKTSVIVEEPVEDIGDLIVEFDPITRPPLDSTDVYFKFEIDDIHFVQKYGENPQMTYPSALTHIFEEYAWIDDDTDPGEENFDTDTYEEGLERLVIMHETDIRYLVRLLSSESSPSAFYKDIIAKKTVAYNALYTDRLVPAIMQTYFTGQTIFNKSWMDIFFPNRSSTLTTYVGNNNTPSAVWKGLLEFGADTAMPPHIKEWYFTKFLKNMKLVLLSMKNDDSLPEEFNDIEIY